MEDSFSEYTKAIYKASDLESAFRTFENEVIHLASTVFFTPISLSH